MNSCEDVNSFEKICSELVEMKDTSELMMDLAYSSLLLNSRELAEEVLQLEEKVDKMHTDFELSVLSRCAVEGDIKGLMALLRMGSTMERIADAAVEIAEVVLKGIEPHPILRIVIEAADETVERGVLSRHSALVGKSLKEARIPEGTGMWVLLIRRGDKWIRPRPDTVLQAGDIIIASGYSDGAEDFKRLLRGEPDKRAGKEMERNEGGVPDDWSELPSR
ncbi:MAG: PhoU domain-containing protein [Candidatus Bathyarchaeia archaeon]|nr:hypothetical protein [Candidatus Bathyarchaeota archaeon]